MNQPLVPSLLAMTLLLCACDDPVQPGSRFWDADSVWVVADYDGIDWSPGDSMDHVLSLTLDHRSNEFQLWAWNRNPVTKKGPGISIVIDSLNGAGNYPATLDGPSRVSFTTTGDGIPAKGGSGFEGVVVLDIFDTLVHNRIHGTFDVRIIQTLPVADTFSLKGEVEGLWK